MQNQLVYNTTTKNQKQFLQKVIFIYFNDEFTNSILLLFLKIRDKRGKRFMIEYFFLFCDEEKRFWFKIYFINIYR